MSDRRGAAVLRVGMVLALVAVLGVSTWLLLDAPDAPEAPQRRGGAAPVLVESVDAESYQERVEALGTVRANEAVTLTAKVTERVTEVLFDDGAPVEAGQILIRLNDAETQAELSEAQSEAEDSRRQLERLQSVIGSGAVSRSDLDVEQTRLNAAEARVQVFQARLTDRVIRAPFAGVLGLRNISPGQLVTPTTDLVTLQDLDPVKVDFTLPERFTGRLQPGDTVEARSVAYPDRLFSGIVRSLDASVDPVTRALRIRATVPNPDRLLKPGMLLSIEVTGVAEETLFVSDSALQPVGNRQFLFRVTPEGLAERLEVKVGRRLPGRVEILDGLEAGSQVITHGFRARDGAPVRVMEEAQVFQAPPASPS